MAKKNKPQATTETTSSTTENILTRDDHAFTFFKAQALAAEIKLPNRGGKLVGYTPFGEDDYHFIEVKYSAKKIFTLTKHEDGYKIELNAAEGSSVGTDLVVAGLADAPVDLALANGYHELLQAEMRGVVDSFCRIGYYLRSIRNGMTYKAYDCPDLYAYGERFFNLKRASINNYILVCEKFSQPDEQGNPTSVLADVFSQFSFSQLVEMMRLPSDKMLEATPLMSCKEIRGLKSADSDDSDVSKSSKTKINGLYEETDLYDRYLKEEDIDLIVSMLRDCIGDSITITCGRFLKSDEVSEG